MATNAALVAAKPAGRKPAEIAALLVAALRRAPEVAEAEQAGPGFVNLRLRPETLQAQVPVILRAGTLYGATRAGQGLRVNVEYVSANPTGPMHIGHCRGAVVGDALANLLTRAGYDVTKEFYVNDSGAQVVALAWATYFSLFASPGNQFDRGRVCRPGSRRAAISWRVSDAGRRSAGGGLRSNLRRAGLERRRPGAMARYRARFRHSKNAGGHQGRSGGTRRCAGRILERTRVAGRWRG